MSAKQKKSIATTPIKLKPQKTAVKGNTGTDISRWAIIAVIVFTAFIYSRAMDNGFTYMDDDYYILRNRYLRDFSFHGLWAIFTHFYSFNYHPLTTVSNLTEYTIFGLNPLPYHLFNVLLHLLNVWLVYRLTEQLSGKRFTALVVAILFAVHPMHVESVAWIAERKDVLYSAFYLSALLVYLRYIESGFRAKHYWAALALFLASLLSKSAAVTLPVLMIAVDIYKGRKIDAKSLLEKVPFLLLSVLFGALAILSQHMGGAINDLSRSYNFITRVFLFTAGLASYFIRLAAPVNLSGIHYFPDLRNAPLPWYYYLSLPFIVLVGWLAARRSLYRKEILFGLSFFLITISVMLQIVAVGSAVTTERYTYISYIGLFYIAGQWISGMWETKYGSTIISVFALFVIIISVQSWNRIGVWKNSDVLFTDIIEKDPDNWRNCYVYYYWGLSKSSDGNQQEAADYYTKALKLKPDFERAYFNRALANDALHNTKAAIADYDQAISLNPKSEEVYNARGWAYYETGDTKSAINDFNKALSLDPKYPEAYNNRGWVYFETGDTKSALRDFDTAILMNPDFTKPYYNRAAIKVNSKDFRGAIEDYNRLIKLNPKDNAAWYSRGIARFGIGNPQACDDWRKAEELGSEDASKLLRQNCK